MGKPILTTKEFIKRSRVIHSNLYDYSKSEYGKNSNCKVEIICSLHGSFMQSPANHLRGAGCMQCAIEKRRNLKKMCFSSFVNKSNSIHKNKYKYNKEFFNGVSKKVKIICPEHGEFFQVGSSHLKGHGCSKCSAYNNGRTPNTTEFFIKKAKSIHKELYDYSKVKYKNLLTPVKIICKQHGDFLQKPREHLNRHGCQKCGVSFRWSKTEWINFCKIKNVLYPFLYISKLYTEDEEFIKIGITTNSVENRLNCISQYNYKIIRSILGNPIQIFDLEKKLHRIFKRYKYKPKVNFGGYTECFDIRILEDKNLKFLLQ